MNLEFGSEYDEFTNEVEAFCKEYSGATITTNDKNLKCMTPCLEMSQAQRGICWQI